MWVGLGCAAVVVAPVWWLTAREFGSAHAQTATSSPVLAPESLLYYPARAFVAWITSHFVVTSDRLIHRQGLIAKRSMEVPLEAINDVRFSQNILERMVGSGDLVIESAGERGQEVFSDVRRPEFVQKTIYEMGERNQDRMTSGRPGPTAPSMTTELQRLADLRDRGVLTEQEFQEQKARILRGAGH